jgi:hypothetical protein
MSSPDKPGLHLTYQCAFTTLAKEKIQKTKMEGIKMAKPAMPHEAHEKHLCYLSNIGFPQSNTKDYKELVKNAQYLCKACGRVAADEQNLCKPVKL